MTQQPSSSPLFSLIIPVYNGGDHFKRCLRSVRASRFTDWELIVVDDGSTDDSSHWAAQFGATVLYTNGRQGPAAARNLGSQQAHGRYLFFTDADCELHADTLSVAAAHLKANPAVDALFGSYDRQPAAQNLVAQYKNLFHHYVHQTSHEQATTFWTGCGCIKRDLFLKLGGFDATRYRRPAIEDIDLGYRLTQQGGQIRLLKPMQVKHLKAWTVLSLLKSDIFDRGIPWTELLFRYQAFRGDLNLQTHNRVSVVAIWGWVGCVAWRLLEGWPPSLSSIFNPPLRGMARVVNTALLVFLPLLLLWLNRDLYRFFQRERGPRFALQAIPLHWLYYFYNAISFGCGLLLHRLRQ